MSNATIKAVLQNKVIEEIETTGEAAKRDRPPATVVVLTPPLIDQFLTLRKQGKDLREIKKTPFQIGPQGQKWTLSNAQIRELEEARLARYNELLVDLVGEPIE